MGCYENTIPRSLSWTFVMSYSIIHVCYFTNMSVIQEYCINLLGGYTKAEVDSLVNESIDKSLSAGFGMGLMAATGALVQLEIDPQRQYKPLDGSKPIPISKIAQELGEGPQQAVSRVGIILKHGDKRPLDNRELEVLRRAKFLFDSIGGVSPETLCDGGQEMIEKMNKHISEYQARYQEQS